MNYNNKAFDEMFKKREKELKKEERAKKRRAKEGQNIEEQKRVLQLLNNYNF